jgi:hypothetical protein
MRADLAAHRATKKQALCTTFLPTVQSANMSAIDGSKQSAFNAAQLEAFHATDFAAVKAT